MSFWPVICGSVAVAFVVEGLALRLAGTEVRKVTTSSSVATSTPFEIATTVGCLSAVAWQWTPHVADAFGRGMVHADNLWYHGPFVARFLQTGGFGDLGTLGYPESRSYPFNSELLHALMTLPFESDVAVPLCNHLIAALALGAAFVFGRHWDVGALAVLATTVVLSLALVASTQPGQMYNDVMAAALILAAAALLVEGGLEARSLAVAGGAAGMAVGTKLSLVGVAGPLLLGVLIVALLARRYSAAIAWLTTAAVTGGFWVIRNWVVHGSPIPYVDIRLGPIDLPASVASEPGESLLATLDDFDAVRQYYGESVQTSLGPLWFVPVLIGLVGCAVLLARSRDWRFMAALSASIGLLSFPMLPLTGGLPVRQQSSLWRLGPDARDGRVGCGGRLPPLGSRRSHLRVCHERGREPRIGPSRSCPCVAGIPRLGCSRCSGDCCRGGVVGSAAAPPFAVTPAPPGDPGGLSIRAHRRRLARLAHSAALSREPLCRQWDRGRGAASAVSRRDRRRCRRARHGGDLRDVRTGPEQQSHGLERTSRPSPIASSQSVPVLENLTRTRSGLRHRVERVAAARDHAGGSARLVHTRPLGGVDRRRR